MLRYLPPTLLVLGCSALGAAAQTAVAPPVPAPAAQAAAKLDEQRYDHFGAGIAPGPWLELATVLADPASHVDKPLRLSGPITAVCQVKGCWMHLGSEASPVMVKFKDYAFFVPKDASGKVAILEGSMSLKQETVEQTRHYLEDAGKHEEAAKITEGRKLYHFVATGVAIEKQRRLDPARFEHFGAGIAEGEWTSVEKVLAEPAAFVGKPLRLGGSIGEVCQVKGCWMQLGSPEQTVLVKFKDYAFFVPKDAAGKLVVIDGSMQWKQETVEQTRHYLEDAGKHEEAKKITEGRKILHFVASGAAIEKAPSFDPTGYESFGAALAAGPYVAVETVLADPQSYVGKTLRVGGPVSAVCQVKGCWMHLGTEANPVMVKFKDYAFFVPKDGAGRHAVLEGSLAWKQETVEQTRHYLEDAGKHEEAAKITEGRKILHFVASGAALSKR
jgi:hypothetical protein